MKALTISIPNIIVSSLSSIVFIGIGLVLVQDIYRDGGIFLLLLFSFLNGILCIAMHFLVFIPSYLIMKGSLQDCHYQEAFKKMLPCLILPLSFLIFVLVAKTNLKNLDYNDLQISVCIIICLISIYSISLFLFVKQIFPNKIKTNEKNHPTFLQ